MRNEIEEGTTWGREPHGEVTTQREGTERGGDNIREGITQGRTT